MWVALYEDFLALPPADTMTQLVKLARLVLEIALSDSDVGSARLPTIVGPGGIVLGYQTSARVRARPLPAIRVKGNSRRGGALRRLGLLGELAQRSQVISEHAKDLAPVHRLRRDRRSRRTGLDPRRPAQAEQMPGTASLRKRCGEATALGGYCAMRAWNSGWAKARLKCAVLSQTA